MLKTLRKPENVRRIMLITILLIIPAFVLFYGWGKLTGREEAMLLFAAKVDGKQITIDQFYQEYRKTLEDLRKQYGDRIDENVIKQLRLPEQVLETLIARHLIIREAKRLGLEVDDKEVTAFISSHPDFQVGGVFDPRRYKQILAYQNKTPAQFESDLKISILEQKLGFILRDFVKVSEDEIRNAFHKKYGKVKVTYLSFLPQFYYSLSAVSDKEAEEFFNSHRSEYRLPTQYRVHYITIPVDEQMKKKVSVSEEEIKSYYETNKNKFLKEGTRTPAFEEVKEKIRQVLLEQKAEEKALEICQDLLTQSIEINNLAELAKKNGLVVKDSGFFSGNYIPELGYEPEFANTVTVLNIGGISEPVKTSYGYHIIELVDKKESRIPSFTEIKDKVKQDVAYVQAVHKAKETATKAYQKISQGARLAEVAQELNVALKVTPFFALEEYVPEIGRNTLFSEVAHSLPIGKVSEIIELKESTLSSEIEEKQIKGYYLLQVIDKSAPDEARLLEEKDKIYYSLLHEKQQQVFSDWLRTLMNRAKIIRNKKLIEQFYT